jgi:hypothetical protein
VAQVEAAIEVEEEATRTTMLKEKTGIPSLLSTGTNLMGITMGYK